MYIHISMYTIAKINSHHKCLCLMPFCNLQKAEERRYKGVAQPNGYHRHRHILLHLLNRTLQHRRCRHRRCRHRRQHHLLNLPTLHRRRHRRCPAIFQDTLEKFCVRNVFTMTMIIGIIIVWTVTRTDHHQKQSNSPTSRNMRFCSSSLPVSVYSRSIQKYHYDKCDV